MPMNLRRSAIIKNYTGAALCVALLLFSALIAWQLWFALKDSRVMMANGNRAMVSLADYTEYQTEQFRSPRNQKALEASLAAPAIFNATGRLINTKTLPELNRTIAEAQTGFKSLNRLVRRTDEQVNESLLPAATEALNQTAQAVRAYGLTAQQTTHAIESLANEGRITMIEARSFLQSPEWQSIWRDLAIVASESAGTARNVDATTANMAAASERFPEIAADLRAFTQEQGKASKIIIGLRIIGALAPFAYLVK